MTDAHQPQLVVLEGMPDATLAATVTYLADLLRECHLVLLGRQQGQATDPVLASLAEGLVPDLEEIRDAFVAAAVCPADDGTVRLEAQVAPAQAPVLVHAQMQLVQLRLLGRRGGLMTRSDPAVVQLIAWIWDEVSDQLHGRAPRRYSPPG